ncbi:MAG: glycoside hydrolase family 55 protein, partial [Pirellulaceae bacterium]|nr:glycoside hydrolase family 55 protein [Pirellulaceae bacterium]
MKQLPQLRVTTLILLAAAWLCTPPAYAQTAVEYYDTAEEFVGPFPSWRNVKTDYGAVGDGQADDTAAIEKALDDMKTVQKNDWAVLYFPAGAYRITKTLSTLRKEHHDHLGSNLVGEDPATTILLWDGPAHQPMLRFDAWYSKVSRLTLDGRGKANGGLVRAGGFSTYNEHSDLVFLDINGIAMNLGNAEAQGIAETAVLRCKFLRCKEGISTINWNTLDIYVWYCLFEDCGKGVYNRMGNYHCYESVFLRSKEFDVGSMNNMVFAFVNNTSIGSKTFLDGIGQYLRGNKIYHPGELPAIHVGSDLTLLDNLVCVRPGATGPAAHCGQSTLAVGNIFTADGWPIRPVHYPHPAAGTLRRDLDQALDGNPATEFGDDGCNMDLGPDNWMSFNAAVVQWNAPEGGERKVVKYALTSGSDAKLDPRDFRLLDAPTPGGPWTEMDSQKGVTFAGREERKEFAIGRPQAARVFRLEIPANASGTPRLRLAEVEFLDEEGRNVLRDKACLITGRNEKWGPYFELDNKLVKQETITV